MKKLTRVLFCIVLATSAACSLSQGPTEKAAASDKIIDHIRQADLLNHLLPILWTKTQINAILPAIEKARQTVTLAHDNEYKQLTALDPKVTEAIDKAMADGSLPGRALLKEINDDFNKLQLTRTVLGAQNESLVYDKLVETLNSGQKKAMANDLDPASVTPGLKVETMTDEQKIRFYIRNILLDPLAYDLLVKLLKSPVVQDK